MTTPSRTTPSRAATAAAAALALAAGLAPAAAHAAPSTHDTTLPAQAALVDAVPTPTLTWYPCRHTFECATLRVPVNYAKPAAGTLAVGVVRLRATNPSARIGSLLVNPGGPGGSGIDMVAGDPVLGAAFPFSPALRERFDIIGFDPRGTGESTAIHCFGSGTEAGEVLAPLTSIPHGDEATGKVFTAAKALHAACARKAPTLARSIHTAQVARDMELLRRALGDPKLSYYGISYGSVLGQYYANMFPERFRALAVDGVIDARDWYGEGERARQQLMLRMGSADASVGALAGLWAACAAAGPDSCPVAALGDPARVFDAVVARLRRGPITVDGTAVTFDDYAMAAIFLMYDPVTAGMFAELTAALSAAATPGARPRALPPTPIPAGTARAYNNILDFTGGVVCGDVRQHSTLADLPPAAAAADRAYGLVGANFAWRLAICARDAWRTKPVHRYNGPFTRTTAVPLLSVGSTYDPVTHVRNAGTVARQMPGSYHMVVDNWGHGAYPQSACARTAVDAYLIAGTRPAGSGCTGDRDPFTPAAEASAPRWVPPPLPGGSR
ncbi:MAG TPA: alpha/beta hydrolase [Pilimelia sp.]|nr:alpha/beta hydrolase [Pilimelia sp.]